MTVRYVTLFLEVAMREIANWLFIFLCYLLCNMVYAHNYSLFDIKNYEQSVSAFINPAQFNYHQVLLPELTQQYYFNIFLSRYVGTTSPWCATHVSALLQQEEGRALPLVIAHLISVFDNTHPLTEHGYGMNFRLYEKPWLDKIVRVMNLQQFDQASYDKHRRGITVDNASGRLLPTTDVFFYDPHRAGEGYPFDYLQETVIFAGTPVYVLGETKDGDWSLVLTPDSLVWINSASVGLVDDQFVDVWIKASYAHLAAIVHTQTPIFDSAGHFLFDGYVGAVFPMQSQKKNVLKIWVPVKKKHQTVLQAIQIAKKYTVLMPLSLTPHHVGVLLETLIGRPYGWGGMDYYNDCSAELKYLFTPFGIWLPRLSTAQIEVAKHVDLSSQSVEEKSSYLMKKGTPFLTLIYVGHHIMLYTGSNKVGNTFVPMTYQSMWGLKPVDKRYVAIVGQSVFLPLLKQYPEDTALTSAFERPYFTLSDLTAPIAQDGARPKRFQDYVSQ